MSIDTSQKPLEDTKNENSSNSKVDSLLSISDLQIYFFTEEGVVKAVEDVNLRISKGETLGLIGESGSGKTVTSLAILKLLQEPPAKVVGGKIYFEGKDLLKIPSDQMRKIRGKKISMIFQDPMTSLNPLYTVKDQIAENLRIHHHMSLDEAEVEVINLMKEVGIPDAKKRSNEFPHQFSGGMRQRIMIAIALSCKPLLLIADEPTTALDVTIQAQVIKLIDLLKEKYQTSILYITHNFAVVASLADRIAVMYAGYIIEEGPVIEIFENPIHPYTQDLLASIPRVDKKISKLEVIQGSVPNLINPPTGCRFHPRCRKVMEICSSQVPERIEYSKNHFVQCHLYT